MNLKEDTNARKLKENHISASLMHLSWQRIFETESSEQNVLPFKLNILRLTS